MGQTRSRDHCKYGLGETMFQVSGVLVLSGEVVRWLTGGQAGACVCVGRASSSQALQLHRWAGVPGSVFCSIAIWS